MPTRINMEMKTEKIMLLGVGAISLSSMLWELDDHFIAIAIFGVILLIYGFFASDGK